jgi:hypothetical protein
MTPTTGARTSTSEARALVRCTRKGCRTAHLAAFTTTVTLEAHEGRPVETRTVTADGRQVYYRDRYDLARIICRDFACTGCGGTGCTFDVVRGTFSESVKCGAKCRSAVGPACECQCGGENHGSGHPAIG